MIRFLGRHGIAIVALFIALGGTAYAANTVRSADIVDGTVQTQDLANKAVTPTKTTGVWTFHTVATQVTSDCAKAAQTWTACAPVTLTVPAGHRYSVTVQSTVEIYVGPTRTEFTLFDYCAASSGPSCFAGTYDELLVSDGETVTASNAGHRVYGPGTYTFSTAMKSYYAVPSFKNAHTTTTVIATDAANTTH